MIMRRDPELAGVVLSKDVLIHRQLGRKGRRAKFGLLVPIDGPSLNAVDAARLIQHRIDRAIRKAGFTVLQPEAHFDPETGLPGLQVWTSRLRLRRRRIFLWLLPLLLPLLWLPPCGSLNRPTLDPQETPSSGGEKINSGTSLFNMPPVDAPFILVLDESPSMKPHFPGIQQEARSYMGAGGTGRRSNLSSTSFGTANNPGAHSMDSDRSMPGWKRH